MTDLPETRNTYKTDYLAYLKRVEEKRNAGIPLENMMIVFGKVLDILEEEGSVTIVMPNNILPYYDLHTSTEESIHIGRNYKPVYIAKRRGKGLIGNLRDISANIYHRASHLIRGKTESALRPWDNSTN